MNYFILAVIFLFAQDPVPFKPKHEFEVKLDYQFRNRPAADHNTVNLEQSRTPYSRNVGTGVLPYLVLNIVLLELSQDKMRVGIANNIDDRPVFKKVSKRSALELDLGFTDDMIDRVTPHEYTLTFVDAEKNPIDRIVISVDEDGSFLVNGEKRGRF